MHKYYTIYAIYTIHKYTNTYLLHIFENLTKFTVFNILHYKTYTMRTKLQIYNKIISKVEAVRSVQFILSINSYSNTYN